MPNIKRTDATLTFGSVTPDFTIRIGIDALSPRDQTTLFNALAERLGLTEAAIERPDESYQVLYGEMMDRVWRQ